MPMENSTGMDMGGDMDMDMGGMDMGGMDMMMMPMYFNFVYLNMTVVFKEWQISNETEFIASCVGVAGVAILYEILKACRQIWIDVSYQPTVDSTSNAIQLKAMSGGNCCEDTDAFPLVFKTTPGFWCEHFLQSVLYIVQIFLGYVLMLIVMTYNVWLVVSVCCGAGVGYLIAGAIRVTTTKQHMRKRAKTIAALRASQQEPTPPPTPKKRMRASSPYANGYDNNGYNTYYEEGAKTKI